MKLTLVPIEWTDIKFNCELTTGKAAGDNRKARSQRRAPVGVSYPRSTTLPLEFSSLTLPPQFCQAARRATQP